MPHEDSFGARRISRRSVLAAGAAVPLLALLDRAVVSAAVPSGASSFRALPPVRIADTRSAAETGYGPFGFTVVDDRTIRVQVTGSGGVPAGAVAAVLNVTAVNANAPGWVKVVPTGSTPAEVSNINVEGPGQILANLVTVQLPASGQVDISCYDPLDVVVDVAGVYISAPGAVSGGRYVGLDQSVRVLDTRNSAGRTKVGARTTQHVDVSQVVPAGASAVVVNLTVTESNGPGFWTAYVPGSNVPTASNLNTDEVDQTRANQAILPIVNNNRSIDVFSYSGGHFVVDVAGYFTGSTAPTGTDGLFVPNTPYRAIDTRRDGRYGRMYPTWVCEFTFAGMNGAQAAVINLTTTETRGPGWFAAYAARTDRPDPASNLNATHVNQTIANHAIARTSTAGIAVYTYAGGDVIADVAGYFTGTPRAVKYGAVQNVVPPPAPLPYTISIPALGINGTIVEGVGDNVVNAGYVGHWPGTGLSGEDDHMVLFAHRTEHGGIFRNIHLLGPGSQVVIRGADGRVFTYEYTDRAITGTAAAAIYNAGLGTALPSLSLVACSKTNYLPTDIHYRCVINFTQINQN